MNVGILYPRSKAHPGLGFDFLDGLKSYIKQQSLTDKISFTSESIGFGGLEKEAYEKAEKLLMVDGVDVLLAYIDQRVLGIMQPLFYASGKLIIIINPGANYPLNWVPQPNTINLTLQHSFLCWLTGKLISQQQNKQSAYASTYFDCGYLHSTAMVKSHNRNGGKLMFNYINNNLYNDSFEISQLTNFLSSDPNTNNLFCVFDSLPASLFYDRLDRFEGAERLNLFVSPMMLESRALANGEKAFKFSIDGYASWLPTATHEENNDFISYYQQQTKRGATIFSLLGWEAGMILQQVLLQSGIDLSDGAEIARNLTAVKMKGPRGEMKLDADTLFYLTPVVKYSVSNGDVEPQIISAADIDPDWQDFVTERTEGAISGWLNTYLCY